MNNFFVSHKNPVTVLAVMIFLAGIFAFKHLQTSLFPEVTFPKIKVIAENGLQPINKMMVTVTKPVEAAIKRVPHVQTVRSTTSRGSCEVSAYLDWGADVDLAQQQIESRIGEIKADLPPNVNVTVEKMNPSILPVMGYVLQGEGKSNIELNYIANYTVKPFLSQVDGISVVKNIGGKTKEYWLELDSRKMSALSITPDMITTVFGQSNFILSNGFVNNYKRLYLTITEAGLTGKSDIENLVLKNDGKRVVLIKDIATVGIREKTEYAKINANGKPALLIAVFKQPTTNLVDVSDSVAAKVAELNKLLPTGVQLKPYYVQADFVHDSIKSVTDSLLVGLLLAIIVAIIFLRSFKASMVILITIPITVGLSLVGIYAFGYTFNIMTLGAIAAAIGLIIDDAIVVVEQIHRTHEEHPNLHTKQLLSGAIKYMFPAMVGSSLSTIVIFIPFALLGGVSGAYFHILTNTMIITLVSSFLVTWIILPVVYLQFSRKHRKHEQPAVDSKHYNWILFFIKRPWISIILVLSLGASIYLIIPQLKTGFLPEIDEGSIVLDYWSPPGTSLDETDRMLKQVEQIILKVPEVEAYSRRTGVEMGFFITEPNKGDYLIQLKKNRKRTTEEVIADIRHRVEESQPALKIDFGQVISDMLGDLMSSVQPIEVKVYGPNQAKLKVLAQQISDIVEKVPGTADVFNGIVIAGPSISVQPNYAKLAQFGITPANLQAQLQTQIEGVEIGNVYEKEQQTTIRMIYNGGRNLPLEKIRQQPIFLPSGKLLPLTELATVSANEGDAEIIRENLESMIAVKSRLKGRDLGSTVKAIQKEVKAKVQLPQGFHIEYGGEFAEQQASFGELLTILGVASLLVFAVILFLYRRIELALLIITLAVLGVSGSLIALFITGTALNVGSYTGLIMIVGIIGENAIFTYLQFNDSLNTNTVDEAIVFAISARLRPKLMTALGAIIALMPLALGIGTGAQLHQPLAVAVIGGFVIAMPLLLVVFPSFLRIIGKEKEEIVLPNENILK